MISTGQTTDQAQATMKRTNPIRWTPPPRPAVHAEHVLLGAILDGTYPAGSTLPAERELAVTIGVTRPTLRETLRGLERDGWLTVRQGKPTLVRNIWMDGGLNVLSALVRYPEYVPDDFVVKLLEVRLALAPAYTRAAIDHASREIVRWLSTYHQLGDTPESYASFDWELHRRLASASGNPVYTLMLNGFAGFYEGMARLYFATPLARATSRRFYSRLLATATRGDPAAAERVTREVMRESIRLWREVHQKGRRA